MKLITEPELADLFGMTAEAIAHKRRKNGWPCVKFSRVDIRYTEQQVEQIVAKHTLAPARVDDATVASGQTKRSASRRRSA